jgi:hypothetical protein
MLRSSNLLKLLLTSAMSTGDPPLDSATSTASRISPVALTNAQGKSFGDSMIYPTA